MKREDRGDLASTLTGSGSRERAASSILAAVQLEVERVAPLVDRVEGVTTKEAESLEVAVEGREDFGRPRNK